jgi:hypothetical protein
MQYFFTLQHDIFDLFYSLLGLIEGIFSVDTAEATIMPRISIMFLRQLGSSFSKI